MRLVLVALYWYDNTHGENKSRNNERNHNPPQNSPIKTTTMAITIATTTIMLTNTKGSILESLLLLTGLEFGNKTFHFDCGINLSSCDIERAGYYGELWLCPLSQDLFSVRVDHDAIVALQPAQLTVYRALHHEHLQIFLFKIFLST